MSNNSVTESRCKDISFKDNNQENDYLFKIY